MTQALLTELPVEKDFPIAHLLRIFDVKLKDTKKGSKYLSFSVGDKSKNIPHCKKWDSSEEELRLSLYYPMRSGRGYCGGILSYKILAISSEFAEITRNHQRRHNFELTGTSLVF